MRRLPFVFASILLCNCSTAAPTLTPSPTGTLRPMPQPTVTASMPGEPAAPIQTPGPTPTPLTHVIEQGDTLLAIAIQYGVELNDLLLVNPGINPRFLSVGDALLIPESGAQGPVPTATPVAILLSEPACYASAADELDCLVLAAPPQGSAVEGVIALVTLSDAQGQGQRTEAAFSPINAVGPGELLPLVARFGPVDFQWTTASAVLASGFELGDADDRYASVQIEDLSTSVAGARGTAAGRLAWEGEVEEIRLVLLALDADGVPLGVRTLVVPADGTREFELTVDSLGGDIDQIVMLVEALRG